MIKKKTEGKNIPITKAWDWSKNTDKNWLTPCIESAYLSERWKVKGFKELLDLGCGLGRHTIYMGIHGFHVTAYDLSDEAIKQTRKWAAKENLQIQAYTGNMLNLPFQNNSFDCLIAYNVIYHTNIEGLKATLHEIHRILRPDGEFFLTLISKSSYSFIHADNNQRIDKNTILRSEQETGDNIPHLFVDLKDIKLFFKDFEFICPPEEDFVYQIENPQWYSVHWKIIAKSKV